MGIVLDFTPDEELIKMALCRDVANRVQKLRKEAKLLPDDPVDMWAEVVAKGKDSNLRDVLVQKADYIDQLLRRKLLNNSTRKGKEQVVRQDEFDIDGDKLRVFITWKGKQPVAVCNL